MGGRDRDSDGGRAGGPGRRPDHPRRPGHFGTGPENGQQLRKLGTAVSPRLDGVLTRAGLGTPIIPMTVCPAGQRGITQPEGRFLPRLGASDRRGNHPEAPRFRLFAGRQGIGAFAILATWTAPTKRPATCIRQGFSGSACFVWSLTTEAGSSPSVSSQLGGNRRGARSKRSRAPARRGDRGRQRDNYRTGRSRSHHPRQHVPRALRRARGFIGRLRLAGGVVHQPGRAPLSRAGNCPGPRQSAPFIHRLAQPHGRLLDARYVSRPARHGLLAEPVRPAGLPASWQSGRRHAAGGSPFGSGNCAAMPFTSCGPRCRLASPAAAPRRIRRRAPGDPIGRRRRPSAGSPARPDTVGRHRPG